MNRIAGASPEERAELFQRTAAKLKPERSPEIIEKDFWVCWSLYRLFSQIRFRPHMIFKGGTSLSKAFNAIERFSEDVDLSFSRADLGINEGNDPEAADISGGTRKKRLEALSAECRRVVKEKLIPELRKDLGTVLGGKGWKIEPDAADPQTVVFHYPVSTSSVYADAYLQPSVRLEMGARSDDWPAEEKEIRSYASEAFPEVFKEAVSCPVRVLSAERTFWEKATLLHAEAHRPASPAPRDRYSRHYYDLCMLGAHAIGKRALQLPELLKRVIEHKSLFFASAWANYDTAFPGTFKLLPKQDRLLLLRQDYARMKGMVFGPYPSWEEITRDLRSLEERINSMSLNKG